MILLDTMVVAEPLREQPNTRVIAWLDSQLAESLCVAALSIAKLQQAASRLPVWRRKEAQHMMNRVIGLFEGRIIPFNAAAAIAYGTVLANVRRGGYSISQPNGLLAAIAMAGPFVIATSDASAFLAAGMTVTDPWDF